jgi:RNA polymerase sigma-70 factor (ECF subfamily)
VAEAVRQLEADAVLVRAVQAGGGEAFAELFRRHYPSVRRACARRLGEGVDADEVTQAAFVKAFERIGQCRGQRRFGSWVHVIAQRLCVDTVRSRARVHPQERPLPADAASTGRGDPEESVLEQERARHLQEALATLSVRQRDAVVARTVEERRPGEIAAALGLSIGAVDSLLLRARRSLALSYGRLAREQGTPS